MADQINPQTEHDIESRRALVDSNDDNRKSFENVVVEEVPASQNPSLVGSLSWSNSNPIGREKNDSIRTPSVKGSLKTRAAATLTKTGTWTYEIVGLMVGAAAVASIAAVLAYFDGRAVPDWPLDITLGALIALLATIANANLAAPIQSSLSQLKWIRFKTGRAPLSDMETYDEASRGVLGALKLLATARGGVFGSFGAILTVVALALGPFSQQIASYRTHIVQSVEGASIPRALNYAACLPGRNASDSFVPILPLKSAVFSGLFAENGDPSGALNVTCSTGNCTYEAFETLAICYSCNDMTSLMSRHCVDDAVSNGDDSNCGWKLPDGMAYLNKSGDVFSMTSSFPSPYGNMPYSTIMQLIFMGTESQTVPDVLNPWALSCRLSTCVQTIQSSVTNGHLSETVVSNFTNGTVVDISNATSSIPVLLTSPATNSSFNMSMEAKLALQSWFADIFQDGSASRSSDATNHSISDGNVVVNLTVGVSSGVTFFDTDIVTAFYWNYYEYPSGVQLLMETLAISMTVAMRSISGVPHAGIAETWESFVYVRWSFISLPVAVVVLTAAFLALTVWYSRRTKTLLWKSSSLAVLFHGIDHETRERIGSAGSLNEKRKRANKIKVRLDDSREAGSMLRV